MPELAFALEAVRTAAGVAQSVRSRLEVKGIEKSDLSPVTVADYACQALIAKRLGETFPDAVLVGEEDAEDLRNDPNGDTLESIAGFVREVEATATRDSVCDWIDQGKGEPGTDSGRSIPSTARRVIFAANSTPSPSRSSRTGGSRWECSAVLTWAATVGRARARRASWLRQWPGRARGASR